MRKSFGWILLRIIFVFVFIALQGVPHASPGGAGIVKAFDNPHFFVVPGGSDTGDGLTWATAYHGLQYAINQVNNKAGCQSYPCELWVAGGVYQPRENNNYYINGGYLQIYGGFSGVETELAQRNWVTNPTTLLGNGYRVLYTYFFLGVVDGFTITGGHNPDQNGRGGGLYIECGGAVFNHLTITGNSTVREKNGMGGGVLLYSTGCSSQTGLQNTFINSVVSNNDANTGGGFYALFSRPSLINVVITGNTAMEAAGIYNYGGSPSLTNSTMAGNDMVNSTNSDPVIRNSILWSAMSGMVTNLDSYCTPAITYSLVKGCNVDGTWNEACGTDAGYNLADADPQFVPGSLHLQSTSPVIDQGNSALIPPGVTPVDLDGNPRISGAAVDLGVYEYQSDNIPPAVSAFTKTGRKNWDIPFHSSDFEAAFSDADGDDLVSILITFLPTSGTLYLGEDPVTVNQEIPATSLSNLYYRPPADWSGLVTAGWNGSDGQAYASSPAAVSMLILAHDVFLAYVVN